MSKKTDLRADLSTFMANLPRAEKEMEEFLAGQIVAAQNDGDKELEAIARFGQTAAISTMVSWRKVMKLVAEMLSAAERATPGAGVNPINVADLDKLGGLVTKSVALLSAMKTKEETKREQEILLDKDSVITRIAGGMQLKNQVGDMNKDNVDRKKLGVKKDGTPEGGDDEL